MSSRVGHAAAYGIGVEEEPIGPDQTRSTLTILLNAKRCPFECVYCDLWMHNHVQATSVGSIPFQIQDALEKSFPSGVPVGENWNIKLYNGGNFTDPSSVPPTDWPSIAELCRPFRRVVIENHATMCGDRLLKFRDCLETELEVAIGLETANARVLSLQNKEMTLDDFDRATSFLRRHGIHLRCFTMLQLPFGEPGQSVQDASDSVLHAVHAGANLVAIIPTRHSTPAMQSLIVSGDHRPPQLRQLEDALSSSLTAVRQVESNCVVTADTWDIEKVEHCSTCRPQSLANIVAMNSTQSAIHSERCVDCDTRISRTAQ